MTSDYCHFNTSHDAHHFPFTLYEYAFHFSQHPGRTDLGHGVVVWDAGVIFAKYLENQSKASTYKVYKDLNVLELGSGCGIAGLALMLNGAKVTFTDLPEVLHQVTRPNIQRIYSEIKASLELSGVEQVLYPPTLLPLDWKHRSAADLSPERGFLEKYDVVLLTDCVFSMDLLDDLVEICVFFTGGRGGKGGKVLCCHERRDEGINTSFLEKLGAHFSLKSIGKRSLHPSYTNDYVSLVQGRRKT